MAKGRSRRAHSLELQLKELGTFPPAEFTSNTRRFGGENSLAFAIQAAIEHPPRISPNYLT
jgi:hypothetical protein